MKREDWCSEVPQSLVGGSLEVERLSDDVHFANSCSLRR